MDSERIAPTLTSMPDEDRLMQAIDAELERVLAVEPSPDFAARVRASIGPADAMRAPRSMYWALAAAALLVAAVGLATFVIQRDGARTEHQMLARVLPPEGGSHDGRVEGSHEGRVDGSSGGRVGGSHRAPTSGRQASSASGLRAHPGGRPRVERNQPIVAARVTRQIDAVPAVLIDPRQRQGLDRLLAVIRSGDTIVPRALADAAAPAQDLTVAAVVVEPLQVPQLPAGGGAPDTNAVRR